jgi:hypothetical protein
MYCFALSADISISSLRWIYGVVVQRRDLSARQLFIRQKKADEARALPRGWGYKMEHGPQQDKGDRVSASPVPLKHKNKTARRREIMCQGAWFFQFTVLRCLRWQGGAPKQFPPALVTFTDVMANRRASRKGNYIIRSPHALPFSHHLLHSHALHRSCGPYVAVLLW